MQIDLIIERKDNIINMCEMKFYSSDFTTSRDFYQVIFHRKRMIEDMSPKHMTVHSPLVTTYGLKYNEYSRAFDNYITVNDVFK